MALTLNCDPTIIAAATTNIATRDILISRTKVALNDNDATLTVNNGDDYYYK